MCLRTRGHCEAPALRLAHLSPLPEHVLVHAGGLGQGRRASHKALLPSGTNVRKRNAGDEPVCSSREGGRAPGKAERGPAFEQGRQKAKQEVAVRQFLCWCKNWCWCNYHVRVYTPCVCVCPGSPPHIGGRGCTCLTCVCHPHSQYLPLCPRASRGGQLVPQAVRRGGGRGRGNTAPTPIALGQ